MQSKKKNIYIYIYYMKLNHEFLSCFILFYSWNIVILLCIVMFVEDFILLIKITFSIKLYI